MNVTDEIRKTLSDPKPLYALAGAGDLAAEKLKGAPERLRDTPTLLTEAGATLTTLANKIAAETPERIAKVTSSVQGAAGKGRPDPKALRDLAQTVAIQQVGRLLEAAGKAVETYDELAERGKVVVDRYAGHTETVPGEAVTVDESVTVLVEQVTPEDELTKAPVEPAAEAAEVFETKPDTAEEAAEVFEDAAEEADEEAAAAKPANTKPAAKKATPRKRATAPRTPRPPKA